MIISTVEDEEILKVEVEEILIKEEIVILNHPTKEKVKILLVRLIEEEVEVTTTKVGAGEEGDEGAWDGGRVEDLEDEAAVVHAEVEGGHGVVHVGQGVGPPLRDEAHDEARRVAGGVGGEP